jgi:hypothetical protein
MISSPEAREARLRQYVIPSQRNSPKNGGAWERPAPASRANKAFEVPLITV